MTLTIVKSRRKRIEIWYIRHRCQPLHSRQTMLERFMDNKFKKIEAQTAILQAELSQMSDELYAQQKEIEQLRVEIGNLKSKLQNVPTDSGILTADEDVPPPHY